MVIWLTAIGQIAGLASVGAQVLPARASGSLETGTPLITNLRPSSGKTPAGLQVWAITEDELGILYFGNNAGIVEYDGHDWRTISVANGSTVRSLARGRDGRIYVGAQNEIGYLEPSSDGETRYLSLTNRLPEGERAFADVWKTYATDEGVFFQTYGSLMLWDGSSFRIWHSATSGSFHFSYFVQGSLIVADRARGLTRWTADGLEMLPGGELFRDMRIYAILPLDNGRLLIAPWGSGLYTLSDGVVEGFPTAADAMLIEASIYHGVRLVDGTIALATIRSGIVVIDQAGSLRRVIDRESGLGTNRVATLFSDSHQALWAGLERGVARIEVPSPLSYFGVKEGLEGLPQDLVRVGPMLYVASTDGLYRLETGKAQNSGVLRPKLRRMPGITSQAWNLELFDDRLLISSLDGVFEFFDRPPRVIWSGRSSFVHRSKRNPDRVFIALFDGMASVRRHGAGWIDEGRWPGIGADIRSLVEDEQGVLWAGTAYEHVLRIEVDHQTGTPLSVERLGADRWPVAVDQVWVFETSNGVGVATNAGLFRFDAASSIFEPDPTFGEELASGEISVAFVKEDSLGDVWIAAERPIGLRVARRQPDRSYILEATPFERLRPETVLSIYTEPAGAVWLGWVDGLHRFDSAEAVDWQPAQPRAIVRRVVALADEAQVMARRTSADNDREPVTLPYQARSLRFDFSQAGIPDDLHGGFQTWLDGVDREWLPWPETRRDVANLAPGDYQLHVRAIAGDGRIGPETLVAFTITSPWYLTWWTLALSAIGLILILWSLQSLLSHHTKKRARVAAVHERRREELARARSLQQRLLPTDVPTSPLVEAAAFQQTASEVGGDYYDFFPQPNGDLFVVMGDATGHGMAAGLMVTATKSALLAMRQEDVGKATEQMNAVLGRIGLENRLNMAMALLRLSRNGDGLHVEACGGGVVPIYLLRPEGKLEEVVLAGLPLGAMQDASYPVHRRDVEAGSYLVLMSDGLPERLSASGKQLGYDRLHIEFKGIAQELSATGAASSSRPSADTVLRRVLEIGDQWAGATSELDDDLTVVVLRVKAPEGEG